MAERTKEIQDINRILQQKHEEISAQNEEITAQNDELSLHREELATQNKPLLESKKQQLQLYSKNFPEKSDLIQKLSEEIDSLKQKSADEEQVKNFSRVLNSTIPTDEDWERFKKTFQEVYPNFFATLRFKFPEITASELRLSALIKMNLSLKEAASTLGISAESVKKSRYRLKKKIALREDESLEVNLFEFYDIDHIDLQLQRYVSILVLCIDSTLTFLHDHQPRFTIMFQTI